MAEGNEISIDYENNQTGDYFIEIGAANDNGYGWYEISLSINETQTDDDYAGDTSTTGRLEVGGNDINGSLEVDGDHDWFAINLLANTT